MTHQSRRPDPRLHHQHRAHSDAAAQRALSFANRDEGAPLATDVRQRMESRFAHSFASVRVHDGADASLAADDVDARAFTVGQNIVLGSGTRELERGASERLLAHELAHTVQNAHAVPSAHAPLVSTGSEAGEADARQAATLVGLGGAAVVGSAPAAVIARSPKEEEPSGSTLNSLSDWMGLGESLTDKSILKGYGDASPKLGALSDAYGAFGGGFEIYHGLEKGGTAGTLDALKGMADVANGVAGVAGSNPVEGMTGAFSGGIDVGRGMYAAINSADEDEAVEGAYTAAGGLANAITGLGDATSNPFISGGGRALGFGLNAGEAIVDWTDAGAVERGDWGKGSNGRNRSGSDAAADAGLDADVAIRRAMPGFMPTLATDVMATGGGALTAMGASWAAAGQGAVKNVDQKINDTWSLDSEEIDWGKTARPWQWLD
ncbi:MAG: DUF4157 domain-containing protein [Gemmatimonadaceae bacterium]